MPNREHLSVNLLDANIERFIDQGSELPDILRNHKLSDAVEIHKSRTGGFVVKKDGLALQSMYNPEKEAETRINDVDLEFAEYIVIFGMGMGYTLREVVKQAPKANIMIHEPDLDILYCALSLNDFGDFKAGDVKIHHDVEEFRANCFFAYRTAKPITVITDPVWIKMYGDLLIKLRKELEQFVIFSKISENTANSRMRQWIDFLMTNLVKAGEFPSLVPLKDRFKGVPAVICSAGPSLNKNVELLKEVQDKFLILSVNTSYRALHKNGVRPHLVTAIESYNIKSLFEGLPTEETNFITSLTTNPDLFKLDFNKTISFVDSYPVYSLWLQKELGQQAFLDVGGSVACATFSIAKYMGADPIILIGQDLAYTNGEYYAKGTNFEDITLDLDEKTGRIKMGNLGSKERIYSDTGTGEKVRNTLELRKIPGWYGDLVPTSEDFNFFRVWFESMSRVMKKEERTAINATEGGAYINGFDHIPLSDVISRYAVNLENHHFDEAILALTPEKDYNLKLSGAVKNTQQELDEIIALCDSVLNQHKIIEKFGIKPQSIHFQKKVRELEKREKKMNEKSHEISLLQGYARESISRIKTDPKAVLELELIDGWKMNFLHSKLVTEAVRQSAIDLQNSMEKAISSGS
ncbi:MAG: motility associated factor glycosyltransferase family protein [Deltaproteobacteria bacterium]|nr:motility associated factor glycosyltransferase family protein [Deltaproteobacteria bacterium]